jgi:hypothetical protein
MFNVSPISAMAGVYVELGLFTGLNIPLGLNEPLPFEDHDPGVFVFTEIGTARLPQASKSAVNDACGGGTIVNTPSSNTSGHGPAGSKVVQRKVTLPIVLGNGVKVELLRLTFEKVPTLGTG